jgi:hypothetical protein
MRLKIIPRGHLKFINNSSLMVLTRRPVEFGMVPTVQCSCSYLLGFTDVKALSHFYLLLSGAKDLPLLSGTSNLCSCSKRDIFAKLRRCT